MVKGMRECTFDADSWGVAQKAEFKGQWREKVAESPSTADSHRGARGQTGGAGDGTPVPPSAGRAGASTRDLCM